MEETSYWVKPGNYKICGSEYYSSSNVLSNNDKLVDKSKFDIREKESLPELLLTLKRQYSWAYCVKYNIQKNYNWQKKTCQVWNASNQYYEWMIKHARTPTHTFTHTPNVCMKTPTHIYTHLLLADHTHTHTHTHTHARAHTHTHTHTHTNTFFTSPQNMGTHWDHIREMVLKESIWGYKVKACTTACYYLYMVCNPNIWICRFQACILLRKKRLINWEKTNIRIFTVNCQDWRAFVA